MLKLIIGNKVYSSWSLRGWLAAKQAGLPFEEVIVPLYKNKDPIKVTAPAPAHMRERLSACGWRETTETAA